MGDEELMPLIAQMIEDRLAQRIGSALSAAGVNAGALDCAGAGDVCAAGGLGLGLKPPAGALAGRVLTSAPAAVPGGRVLYPKSDGWYERDAAGVEKRLSLDGHPHAELAAASHSHAGLFVPCEPFDMRDSTSIVWDGTASRGVGWHWFDSGNNPQIGGAKALALYVSGYWMVQGWDCQLNVHQPGVNPAAFGMCSVLAYMRDHMGGIVKTNPANGGIAVNIALHPLQNAVLRCTGYWI